MPKVRVPGVGVVAFPDTMSHDAIVQEVERMAAPSSAPASSTAAPPRAKAQPGQVPDLSRALPSVYGMVGGSLGPPMLRPLTSGAFGAVGEGQRQLQDVLFGGGQFDLAGLRDAFLEQGAAQGFGQILGGGANLAAKGLMGASIRPGMLQAEFPTITEDALSYRTPVGRGVKFLPGGIEKGSAKANALRESSSAKTATELKRLGQSGVRITSDQLAQQAIDDVIAVAQAKGLPGIPPRERSKLVTKVMKAANDILKRKAHGANLGASNTFTPEEVKMVAQIAQSEVAPTLTNAARGRVKFDPDLMKAMETSATSSKNKIGNIGAQEAETQRLIGLNRALISAENRGGGGWGAWGIPAAIGGAGAAQGGFEPSDPARFLLLALAAHGVLRPEVMSRLALGMSSPATQTLLRQAPRTGLMVNDVYSVPPDTTGR